MRRLVTLVSVLLLFSVEAWAQTAQQLPPPVDWRDAGLMQGFPPDAAKVVNQANWLTYPKVSWSFQHARELFPTRTISRGCVRPQECLLVPMPGHYLHFQDRRGGFSISPGDMEILSVLPLPPDVVSRNLTPEGS